jgi:DNA-binding CsgD family transcriptional regulator
MSATALEWSPSGVFAKPIDNLAIIEIETRAGESAGRQLGQMLIDLETVTDAQHAVPIYRAAASLALWQGDHADALRAATRGWELIRETGDWSLLAKMAATVAEVDSMAAADATARRDLATLATIRGRATDVVRAARAAIERSGVGPRIGSRREADVWLALATAHQHRLEGSDDPEAWDRLARAWAELGNPYELAKARWRQAEAILAGGEGRAGRARARPPLEEVAGIALELSARPLLREVRDLANRAMIRLPDAVDELLDAPERIAPSAEHGNRRGPDGDLIAVGPGTAESAATRDRGQQQRGNGWSSDSAVTRGVVGEATTEKRDTFGLSPREREVLALIAEGRTNREIGKRLFISQKTVGVHVGNILAKLSVSGRVEAAAVAIRLGLTESSPAGSSFGR